MTVTIREARPEDAAECGRICYEAFHAIASAHNFPPDFPSVEAGVGAISGMLARPGIYGVVAEEDGRILGSNFLAERSAVSGVGPITVDPTVQNKGVGALLMQAVMERSAAKGFAGVRLVQAGYHTRSLSLYSKLGFDVREHLSCMKGPEINETIEGYAVRPATPGDLEICNALCAAPSTASLAAANWATPSTRARPASSSATAASPAMRPRSPSSPTPSARPPTI